MYCCAKSSLYITNAMRSINGASLKEHWAAHEFVQILNVGNNHCITVSTIGCTPSSIKVYDSLHGKLSTRTKKIIAELMMTQDKAILVYYPGVQWLSGVNDCRLFTVAFATSLCIGQDPLK